jgi:rhodanese-related sulfurtransferase
MKVQLLALGLVVCGIGCQNREEADVATAPASSQPTTGTSPEAAVKAPDPVMHVNPEQASKLLAENKQATVLDIRTPEEFAAGHIEGATNIDFNAPDFESKVAGLDKTKPYVVHCGSGGRSTRSLETFKKNQFESIYHLDGGLSAWKKAGMPVQE